LYAVEPLQPLPVSIQEFAQLGEDGRETNALLKMGVTR
jgi:hypothetical protein